MKTVSAAEANRHFSKILRDVRAGETVIVTSRGEPVVQIQPPSRTPAEQEAAKQELLAYLRTRPSRESRHYLDAGRALRRLILEPRLP